MTGFILTAALGLTLTLCLGSCDNPSGGSDDTAYAAREAADSFYQEHTETLELPVYMVTLSRGAALDAALAAYENLSAGAQALLVEEKAHLDRLKESLTGLMALAEQGAYAAASDLGAALAAQPDNTVDSPYTAVYTGKEPPKTLYKALAAGGKYVALDLSGSGVTEFNTGTEAGRNRVVSLILPDSLTEIRDGEDANAVFKGFTNLKMIGAAALVRLGGHTFNGLTGLETVNLPKTEHIGTSAFYNCPSLSTVQLPEAKSLAGYSFRNCTSLETVSLPKAVDIGSGVFQGCTGLTTVDLPKAVTLGSNVFQGCTGLTTVDLPEAVTIGRSNTSANYVFRDCTSLTTVSLPKAAKIENYLFQGCTSLAAVILGAVPPEIGTRIFQGAAGTSSRTITFKVPDVSVYTGAGTPWSDKINVNNASVGNYWDNSAATRDKLTVALESL
jgi:hypothetical protein